MDIVHCKMMKLLDKLVFKFDSRFSFNITTVDNLFGTFFQILKGLPKAGFAICVFVFKMAELKLPLSKLNYCYFFGVIQIEEFIDIPFDFKIKSIMILFSYFDRMLYFLLIR